MPAAEPRPVEIRELNGIPLVYVDVPGPTTAALYFRGGVADETIPTRGVAHLCEHLALHRFGDQDHHHNASVDGISTVFHVTGTPADVVAFFAKLGPELGRSHSERMSVEKSILRIEGRQRGWNPDAALRLARYGARGHGLPGTREFGLVSLEADDIERWQATTYVRQNAVLAVSGEMPSGLSLTLPDGPQRPLVPAKALDGVAFPGSTIWERPFLGVSFQAKRTTAFSAALSTLDKQLRRNLRYDRGLVYDVGGTYTPLSPTWTHAAVWTETQPEHADKVKVEMLRVLDALKSNGPTVDELASQAKERAESSSTPEAARYHVMYSAVQLLLGGKVLQARQLMDEQRALTPDAVALALQEASWSVVFGQPSTTAPLGSRFPLIQRRRTPRSTGRVFKSAGRPLQRRPAAAQGLKSPLQRRRSWDLTVGKDALTISSHADVVTYAFGDIVGYGIMKDGSRMIWRVDVDSLIITPSAWRDGEALVEMLDGLIDQKVQFQYDDSLVP